MAILYPFDPTLQGHVVEHIIDMSNLQIPFIVFEKGSFFVDKLYGVIAGTNKLVQPGIDFKVMSLNEFIPYNENKALNDTLKKHYIRNVILWLAGSSIGEVTWHVPYCGGEDELKAAEYDNYVSQLYNAARDEGTVNLLTAPYQGWGVFISKNRGQWLAGNHIWTEGTPIGENPSELNLLWGKTDLAFVALADVIRTGADPMEMKAYKDWLAKNVEFIKKYRDNKLMDVYDQVDALEDIRLDEGQLVFTQEKTYTYIGKTNGYMPMYNAILRGLDTKGDPAKNPSGKFTGTTSVGFWGMAKTTSDKLAGVAKGVGVFEKTPKDPIITNAATLTRFEQNYSADGPKRSFSGTMASKISGQPLPDSTVTMVTALSTVTVKVNGGKPVVNFNINYPVGFTGIRDNVTAYVNNPVDELVIKEYAGAISAPYNNPSALMDYQLSIPDTNLEFTPDAPYGSTRPILVRVTRKLTTVGETMHLTGNFLTGDLVNPQKVRFRNPAGTGAPVTFLNLVFGIGVSEVTAVAYAAEPSHTSAQGEMKNNLFNFELRAVGGILPVAELTYRYYPNPYTSTEYNYLKCIEPGYIFLPSDKVRFSLTGVPHIRFPPDMLMVKIKGLTYLSDYHFLITHITRDRYEITISFTSEYGRLTNKVAEHVMVVTSLDGKYTLSNEVVTFMEPHTPERSGGNLSLTDGSTNTIVRNDGVAEMSVYHRISPSGIVDELQVPTVTLPEGVDIKLVGPPVLLNSGRLASYFIADSTYAGQHKVTYKWVDGCGGVYKATVTITIPAKAQVSVIATTPNNTPIESIRMDEPFQLRLRLKPGTYTGYTIAPITTNGLQLTGKDPNRFTEGNGEVIPLPPGETNILITKNPYVAFTKVGASELGVLPYDLGLRLINAAGGIHDPKAIIHIDTGKLRANLVEYDSVSQKWLSVDYLRSGAECTLFVSDPPADMLAATEITIRTLYVSNKATTIKPIDNGKTLMLVFTNAVLPQHASIDLSLVYDSKKYLLAGRYRVI